MNEVVGSSITPRLKEAMVYLAQSELYTQAPAVLKLLTGVDQSQASFWRLVQDCGHRLEPLLAEAPAAPPPAVDQIVYCMADGSMLFTDEGCGRRAGRK